MNYSKVVELSLRNFTSQWTSPLVKMIKIGLIPGAKSFSVSIIE